MDDIFRFLSELRGGPMKLKVGQIKMNNMRLDVISIHFLQTFLAAGVAEQICLTVLVFSSFLFSNLYLSCQNWDPLRLLDFQSLLGTIPFRALCPSGHSALWGPLSFRTPCPPGASAHRGPLPFSDLCKCRLFGHQESLLFSVLYFLGYLHFWELC